MKLYFIRHTSVDVPKSVCYGQTNVPLKDTFESEAEVVRQKIKDIPFDAVYSSPLSRCRKLARYCGYEDSMQLHDRLKELNFGDWEMQEWDKILGLDDWFNDWVNTPAKNGESFKQMYDRLSSFLKELKENNFENVAIFTHGGIISCAKVYFGHTAFDKAFESVPQYGEITVFDFDEKV